MGCSPPGFSVHGIFQARTLECIAISSRSSSQPRNWTCVSCIFCIGGRFSTTAPPGKPVFYASILQFLGWIFKNFASMKVASLYVTFYEFWLNAVCVYVCSKSLQSCLTLCDTMDCSLPGYSMGFSRQEYWNGLLRPPPGDLPNPGIELESPVAAAL